MSETLREEEGDYEVAEDEDGQDQADRVLGAHSRSTPLRTSRITTNRATVRPM
jgi:hypothetical protein